MEELFRYINIISKHTNVFLDQVLEQFGLCSHHRYFIRKIVEIPGITRDKIKTMVHIHPSNTTRIIDALELKEFIIKKTNEQDKRICELYPTNKLQEVYKVLVDAEDKWIKYLTKNMSDEEIENFSKFLKESAIKSIEYIHK